MAAKVERAGIGRRRRALRIAVSLLFVVALPGGAETVRRLAGDGMVATVAGDRRIHLEVLPLRGEGLLAFSRRLTGGEEAVDRIRADNGGARRLRAGVRYRVALDLLVATLQRRTVEALFPEDRARPEGWSHVVAEEVPGQSLWHVAAWFTGRGENFAAVRDFNGLADDTIRFGQTLIVPADLLLPALRSVLPPAEAPYDLEYQPAAELAVYRLNAGEALYSSVVVRFTGRTFAEDVNALAAELASLNGIEDVTDIPVGREVGIPFDLLLPEFLPPGHPRRVEYEQDLEASARYSNSVRAAKLTGITVILDAGHGGSDPGALIRGVPESAYVYDIMVRVKEVLERTTAARVVPTIRDGDGFRIVDRDVLPVSRRHAVLTTPPYPLEDASTGVHLRWYLANSVYARAVAERPDPEKVVFLSLHADSLHASLRGAMAYIPATSLTRGEYGKSGSVFLARREVKERPRVSFTWKERVRSEGLSRQLAGQLIDSFRRHGLAVHKEHPIRDRVVRSRRSRAFVPAVIRLNAVPAKVLLEVCNINNPEERRLLQSRGFRQEVASAVVEGILHYYGETSGGGAVRVAKAR